MGKDFYTFDAGMIIDDYLYFSSNMLNGLYKRDIKTGDTELIGVFPNEEITRDHLHKNCILWNNMLVFLPELSSHIHIWNFEQNNFLSIKIGKKSESVRFADGCIYNDILYIFPAVLDQPLITLNLVNREVAYNNTFNKWCKKNISNNTNRFTFARILIDDNFCFLPVIGYNIIVKYNLQSSKIEMQKTSIDNLFALSKSNNDIWVITYNKNVVYKTDINFVDFKAVLCDIDEQPERRVINNIITTDEEVYLLPAWEEKIYIYDAYKQKFVELFDAKQKIQFYFNDDVRFFRYAISGSGAVIFPRSSSGLVLLSGKNCEVIENNFNAELYRTRFNLHYSEYIKALFNREEIPMESEHITLQDFIKNIVCEE